MLTAYLISASFGRYSQWTFENYSKPKVFRHFAMELNKHYLPY